MNFRPATPYTRSTATAKAQTLHPGAFCKNAADSAKQERCQVLVEEHQSQPGTYLVASGPDWVTALEGFFNWMEEHRGKEEARR